MPVFNGSIAVDTWTGIAGNDTYFGNGGLDTLTVGFGTGNDKFFGAATVGPFFVNVNSGVKTLLATSTGFHDIATMSDGGGYRDVFDPITGFVIGIDVPSISRSMSLVDGTTVVSDSGNYFVWNTFKAIDTVELSHVSTLGAPFAPIKNSGGGIGNEIFACSNFTDSVTAGAGADAIFANGGADTVNGEAGYDYISAGARDNDVDVFDGGADIDTISYSFSNLPVYINLDTGLSRVLADTATDLISNFEWAVGGQASDILLGSSRDEGFYGRGGDDYVDTGAGADFAYGGVGNDIILGQAGDDTLFGDAGTDYIFGGGGRNQMTGGAGLDIFVSEGSADTMDGGADQNYYYRQAAGASSITGGTGVDIFVGSAFLSNDIFTGNDGDDFALGGSGDDSLVGGANNDILIGEDGNDTLDGGTGVNYLYADGTGSDLIRINALIGLQTQLLVQFEGGGATDSVNITGSTLTSFAQFQALAAGLGTVINGNLLQNAGAGAILTLGLGTGNQTDIWFLGTLAGGITSADLSFG
jgi:Ca2+-binding RTX toxin-like protein